jgi:hypothetical protein
MAGTMAEEVTTRITSFAPQSLTLLRRLPTLSNPKSEICNHQSRELAHGNRSRLFQLRGQDGVSGRRRGAGRALPDV